MVGAVMTAPTAAIRMTASGTRAKFSGCRVQVRFPSLNRPSGLNVGSGCHSARAVRGHVRDGLNFSCNSWCEHARSRSNIIVGSI